MFRKQKGLGLLELMLVIVIAVAIIIAGIRFYQTYRRQEQFLSLKDNVKVLLHGVSAYYRAHCITNLTGYTYNKNHGEFPPETAVQPLTSIDLNMNEVMPYFGNESSFTINPFGPHANSTFKLSLYAAKETTKFGATILWQSQVKACITTFGTNEQTVKGMFDADEASSCSGGVKLTWRTLPSYAMNKSVNLLTATQSLYNKMNQWGPWMQDKRSGLNNYKENVNYLCQT
jgi:hypothetical protein